VTTQHQILLGPPGTGKTTSLLDIVCAELERGTPPGRIGFVSFTKAAAEEAVTRARERFGLQRSDFPWFRTLHSLCYRSLGCRPGDVLDGKNLREFAVWAGIDVSGKFADDYEGYTEGDRIMHMEHLARVQCRPLQDVYNEDDDNLPWREVDRVARHLGAYKVARGMYDYTDLLSNFVAQGAPPALDCLLVDEVQDLSNLQWRVVDLLARWTPRVTYAGDDDQAIYRWAGAASDVLVDLAYPARVLGQSYRVPRAVQSVAASVIGGVVHRRPKEWAAREVDGVVERVSTLSDAEVETGDSVLVLARNTFIIATQIVPELRRRGVYYSWGDRGAVTQEVLSAIQTWEALRAGRRVGVEEAVQVYGYMSMGRGYERGHRELPAFDREDTVSMEDLVARGGLLGEPAIWHEKLTKLPVDEVAFILAARRRGERIVGPPRVRLSTIHGAKGGEADHVVLMTEIAARTAREREANPDDEARVWYVGATRAREKLTIVDTVAKNRYEI
jgi:DNA helicase-2/ATP-dependent DNA helicase PcrA